jgi:hypothetical protein
MLARLHKDGNDWFVVHSYPATFEPKQISVRWKVIRSEVKGLGCWDESATEGIDVQHLSGDVWQAYRQGTYLVVVTEHEGTASETPVPCPKVRKGIETRWHQGAWQKYLQTKGWVAA